MKVFCEDCKHLKDTGIDNAGFFNCKHPDNTTQSQNPDTWLRSGAYREEYDRRPSEINILNQCPWYEGKLNG